MLKLLSNLMFILYVCKGNLAIMTVHYMCNIDFIILFIY